MMDLIKTEFNRLEVQAKLDTQKTMLERNKLGQYATPPALAEQILDHGIGLLNEDQPVTFLDPAFGTGAFFTALLKTLGTRQLTSAKGFEVDHHYGIAAKRIWENKNIDICIEDFTTQTPKLSDQVNLVICNPPYVRHHHIRPDEKKRLQLQALDSCGVNLNGLAGLYCYFLGLTHRWLEPGAISGWLIPSEFMTVNYGRMVKEYLLNKVTLLQIHRFDPKDAQFDDALVSSAIVWFKNNLPNKNNDVKFSFGGSLKKPRQVRRVAQKDISAFDKWTKFPQSDVKAAYHGATLGDFFDIKRGIATGDNKFFIMTLKDIKRRDLPLECFQPVLPSSRYLKSDIVEADENGWPLIDSQLFVLNTDISEHALKSVYPKLAKYLESGRVGESPVTNRYICRHRKLWYSQEYRPAAPIVCTYMGRGSATRRPFRFILNHSNATACNVFLMLYPKPILQATLKTDPKILEKIWQDLNDIKPETLLSHGRVYGGGLYKLEPKELRSIPTRCLENSLHVETNQCEDSLAS